MTVIDLARKFLHVREAKDAPNSGLRVEAIQMWGGGSKGDSWCCWLVTMILDLFYGGKAPIPRTGSCQEVYELAKKEGWIVDDPQPGDLFVYVDDNGHAHHIGFITVVPPLTGLAGNTSEDGKSSNGTGCFEHELNVQPKHIKYIRLP